MDTIDWSTMDEANHLVTKIVQENGLLYVHTVSIILNGAHGGADVTVKGFKGNDVSLYNEVTITAQVH